MRLDHIDVYIFLNFTIFYLHFNFQLFKVGRYLQFLYRCVLVYIIPPRTDLEEYTKNCISSADPKCRKNESEKKYKLSRRVVSFLVTLYES